MKPEIKSCGEWEGAFFQAWKIVERFLKRKPQNLLISPEEHADIRISRQVLKHLQANDFRINKFFEDEPLIKLENGVPDYLSSIFYLVNCLQEYQNQATDNLNRFPYTESIQNKFSISESDLVSDYAKRLIRENKSLQNCGLIHDSPSRIFLSHDNDVFYGSLRFDGFHAIKAGRIDWLLSIVFREIFTQPLWMNMDFIMDIEDEHDVKSTFFWLVNKGPVRIPESNRILRNADYNLYGNREQITYNKIEERGWHNGLHKSISPESFDEETSKLPTRAIANRNHYLKFRLPNHFCDLEDSNLLMDSSLGFAEHPGWRNSFSQPFRPFLIEQKKEASFVEVPLAIMDTTFRTYLKWKPERIENWVVDFIDNNKNGACFGVLWHNKFFTPYKFRGYLRIYKTIIKLMQENQIKSIQPQEIIDLYGKD